MAKNITISEAAANELMIQKFIAQAS